MARNEGHPAAYLRFHKDLDNISSADFYLRIENKPPEKKKNTTWLTGASLKGPAELYVGFETISQHMME